MKVTEIGIKIDEDNHAYLIPFSEDDDIIMVYLAKTGDGYQDAFFRLQLGEFLKLAESLKKVAINMGPM